ncbi:cytochrome P450 4C1-like [Portunus trituberculatus]|uniref:cytochrome P450 4C1-like n=1 Tax=Portunus trituberculatus TaxID=210409 RepID=UPI001E1CD75B|nr:cytochrome P450 4C1-like [Portunus trituberculatus]
MGGKARAEDGRWLIPGGVTLSLLALLMLSWYWRRRRMVRLINKLPGPPGLPLLGNALDVNIDIVDLFPLGCLVTREFGPIFKVWLGTTPLVVISGARQAEIILSSQKHIQKSHQYEFFHPWLGNTGLFVANADTWPQRRKLLTPAFHLKILGEFLEVFHRQSLKMVDKLGEAAVGGKLVDVFPFITNCTLDAICETTMGCSINAQDNPESEYVEAVHRMQQLVQQRMLIVWLQLDVIFKALGYGKQQDSLLRTLHSFTRTIIKRRRKMFEERRKDGADNTTRKKPRLAFLDLLLEYSADGAVLSEESIREEVDLFVFAGHDTTAVAISWFLYLMGRHPEAQARVQEELDTIFQGSDRVATVEDLRNMRYTENCIKEALRLFPSVPYIGRVLKEDVTIDGYCIPKGTTIFIFNYALHRDASEFPDPEKFDPDRFLPENVAKRHPFSYIPFSAGPRNCIGQKFGMMEEKITVANLLRRYTVESKTPMDELKLRSEIVLRPDEGNLVYLHPRCDKGRKAREDKTGEACGDIVSRAKEEEEEEKGGVQEEEVNDGGVKEGVIKRGTEGEEVRCRGTCVSLYPEPKESPLVTPWRSWKERV